MLEDITFETWNELEIPLGVLNAPLDIVFDNTIVETIYSPEIITFSET